MAVTLNPAPDMMAIASTSKDWRLKNAATLNIPTGDKRWPRFVGHEFDFVKWSFADVGLSTAPLAARWAGQERAARWGTRPAIYAACCHAGRLAK
jgi:hypothetical protein